MILKDNSTFLCEKARKAICLFWKKSKHFGKLPPQIMIHSYNTLIRPILLYGSDVWGFSKNAWESIDKVCKWFIRCIINVKPTTSNLITFGEVGIFPPSLYSKINVMLYFIRVKSMGENTIAKIVFNELERLDDIGFKNWVSNVNDLAGEFGIALHNLENTGACIDQIKKTVMSQYENKWLKNINNIDVNPLLRTYRLFKDKFFLEPYLIHVKNDKHRIALSKFRCSSHMLEIERGRYTNPITPIVNLEIPKLG